MASRSRWRLILVAVIFNLLFEYSMRGVNDLLAHPVLFLFLFGVYFAYFTMLEDLIARYRLGDYHLISLGFFFGLVAGLILPSGFFTPPLFLGVNWGNMLFINLVWWGILQGVLTFYIANRVAPRDWNHQLLSKKGWCISLLLLVSILLLFRLKAVNMPRVSLSGFLTIISLSIFLFLVLKKEFEKKRKEYLIFKPSRFMDLTATSTILVFTYSALFLTHNQIMLSIHRVNMPAVRLVSIWSIIVATMVTTYRLYRRKPIPI